MFEGILQPTHLILVLAIVLIVFGPGKLPEIGGSLGKSFVEFKRSFQGDAETKPESAAAEPQATSARECPSCHAQNAVDIAFCGQCGTKLVA